ncbi:MAG: dicarboxylate/amino acid:cation symporter [Chlamydiia bacterium]|nr:dicarboxylate/amino acid:cation symporter [Chlamydiia bacterium]
MNKSHRNRKRPWGIFLAIILAILFGSYVGKDGGLLGVSFYTIFDTLGTIFLNSLTLVVVPLVSSSIISGIARIGGEGGFGRLGIKMFTFYLGTSLLAILIGLFFVNLIGPGNAHIVPPISAAEPSQLTQLKEQIVEGQTLISVLVSIVPSNILNALTHGEMLGLIFFSLIFGYAITKIDSHSASVLKGFFQGIFQAMIHFTHIIMKFLPYGVFCLVAKVFMVSGIGSLESLGLFFLTVVLGLMVFSLVGLPLLLKYVARVKPMRHFKAMSPALLTAFSTSSSSATLPVTIDCVEKRAGVSNRICSLVIPLGTSINMSGSALYECVAAMFVAQAYGIDLSFTTQFLVVFMALVTSIGVAGIPSASLVALLVILRVIGLPPEGIGLFIAVDRLLDMCRTTVNVFSDSCCAILVARSEGETQVLAHDIVESP